MSSLPSVLQLLCLSLLSLSFVFAYSDISDDTLRILPPPRDIDFDIKNGALLAPILRTRVPGTEGSTAVLQHFVDFFRDALPDWELSFQNSSSKTPATGSKEVPFVNLIATRDPPWAPVGEVSRLSLVAHYDSKLTPEGFIGAIDSAAPCAMLMHTAQSLDQALTRKWDDMKAQGETDGLDGEKGIQIILLDGEEAFATWTDTDSCYGSRSLAEDWENTFHVAASTNKNFLSSISLFVLLDLLGSKLDGKATIRSYFKTTHWAYQKMAKLESRLRSGKQLESASADTKHAVREDEVEARASTLQDPLFFPEVDKTTFSQFTVGDDHEPFMKRGVDILHLIPMPFPDVWHTLQDDGEHLDMPTVKDWALIVTAFASEWMELDGYYKPKDGTHRRRPQQQPSHDKSEL